MHTGGSSGAETIRVNVEVLEYQIQGNQRQLLLCRTYATIAYVRDNAVCRMKNAVREYASSLMCDTSLFLKIMTRKT